MMVYPQLRQKANVTTKNLWWTPFSSNSCFLKQFLMVWPFSKLQKISLWKRSGQGLTRELWVLCTCSHPLALILPKRNQSYLEKRLKGCDPSSYIQGLSLTSWFCFHSLDRVPFSPEVTALRGGKIFHKYKEILLFKEYIPQKKYFYPVGLRVYQKAVFPTHSSSLDSNSSFPAWQVSDESDI